MKITSLRLKTFYRIFTEFKNFYRIYPQPKSIVSLNGNILSMIGK